MQRYYKTLWANGSIDVFSSSNKQSKSIHEKTVRDKGGEVVQITKQEYKRLESINVVCAAER